MKKLLRTVQSATDMTSDNCYFSTECILSLLKEIEEFKDKEIKLLDSKSGNIEFLIGDMAYVLTD